MTLAATGRAAAGAAALAALLGAGCGEPARLDVPRAEASIAERLAETFDVEVDGVSCPERVEVAAGRAFTCRATVAGSPLTVVVEQADGTGRLAVEPRAAVLVRDRVEGDIATVLADRFAREGATVRCPGPEVRVEEPAATFTCEATDGDEERTVEVRVRDARGALAYTLR